MIKNTNNKQMFDVNMMYLVSQLSNNLGGT